MALVVIVAIIFVLTILVLVFFRLQQMKVRVTGALTNSYSALEAAEAGVHLAAVEMRYSQGWATHELSIGPGGEFVWGNELFRDLKSTGGDGITFERNAEEGTFIGSVGKEPFRAEFRVRVGRIPLADDPDTAGIDESNRFFLIESRARKPDPTGKWDRYTRLDVIAEVSNFTEYVIYDAEKLVLGMGSPKDPLSTNLFADGRLYGHQAVKLGNIENNGTRQRFVNLASLRSAGNITVGASDQFDITFQKPKELQSTQVRLSAANDSDGPSAVETAEGNVLDGAHGGALTVPRLDKAFYRKAAANGIDVSGRPAAPEAFKLYPQEPDNLIHLDFGRPGYENSPIPPDDDKALGQSYPADFNGLIYSDKPVTVWGCPDRDVTIFCEGDIYISGDYNLHPNHRHNYKHRARGIPGTPFYEYQDADKVKYVDPNDMSIRIDDGTEQRKACALISMGRIWIDMRHPARFLGNELKPLIKYEIMQLLSNQQNAYDYVKYDDPGIHPGLAPSPVPRSSVMAGQDLSPMLRTYFGQNGLTDAANNLYVTPETYQKILTAFDQATRDGQLDRVDLDGDTAAGTQGILDVIVQGMVEDEPQFQAFWTGPRAWDKPPALASWNAPQRLYDLVYHENGVTPPKGPYSDESGLDPAMQKDEFYLPQMDITAMLFINAARNDSSDTDPRFDDPAFTNRHFDELGNATGPTVPSGRPSPHFLSRRYRINTGDVSEFKMPLIQRIVGSEIRLAGKKNHPPRLVTGYYWPSLRRRVYDRTLSSHPPPLILQSIQFNCWTQKGATKDDFESF